MGTRQANRQRSREIQTLTGKLAGLRAQLAETERTLDDARERSVDIVADSLNLIEDYVDALAKVLNLDAAQVLDDEATHHLGSVDRNIHTTTYWFLILKPELVLNPMVDRHPGSIGGPIVVILT